MAHTKKGRLEEDASQVKQAVNIASYDATMHNNLAVILAAQGKYEEAISHYSKALRIRPDFDFARKQLKKAKAEQKSK